MGKFLSLLLKQVKIISLFPALLFLICLVIISQAYVPGTWLSGWDTLHPEFDFLLNIKRQIFGVFREEQGLGAVAAHSHMADLPRTLFLWLSSVVIPQNLLRFFYIALCLPIGVLGTYFFIKNIILENLEKRLKESFAFLGALFYLFNLGTLQHFYVPFEMFTAAYAFIPWLFLTASNFLKLHTKKNLLYFSLVTLLAAPMAYAPLLWYAVFGSLFLYLLFFIRQSKKHVLVLISLTLLINSFWILPNLYFLLSGSAALVPEARINKIFSDEAFLYNQSYGSLNDALIYKNFLFDWTALSSNSNFDYLLAEWKNYLTPLVSSIGYFVSAIALLGLFFIKKIKNKSDDFTKALIAPIILSLIFLINSSFPFDYLFSYLRDNFSIFREAFRFPFTKFSLILMFGFSVFFALGNYFIYSLFSKVNRMRKFLNSLLITQVITLSAFLIIYMFPFFNGELISSKMFVKIPQEYFQTFNYLNSQDENLRVSFLPVHSFWGWVYYDFGFQGAQFVTFGIKQPVMDRDWDRWNPANEQYYKEFSYAVYSQNPQLLKKVLDKYKLGFLIVDENIIAPDANEYQKNLYLDQTKLLLDNSDFLVLEKQFNKLSIYKYDQKVSDIEKVKQFNSLSAEYKAGDIDFAYLNRGNYIQNTGSKDFMNYPLLNNIDNQNYLDKNNFELDNQKVYLKLNEETKKLTINLRDYITAENSIPVDIYTRRELDSLIISFKLATSLTNEELNIKREVPLGNFVSSEILLNIDKYQSLKLKNIDNLFEVNQGRVFIPTNVYSNISLYDTFNFEKSENRIVDNFTTLSNKSNFALNLCNKAQENQVFSVGVSEGGDLKLASKNSRACLWIPLNKIFDKEKLDDFKNLIKFQFNVNSSEDVIGRYCIFDKFLERCVKEKKYLTHESIIEDYFSISPEDLDRLELVLYLDGVNNNKLEEITYSNLELESGGSSIIFTLTPEDLFNMVGDKKISLSGVETMVLNYPENSLDEKFNLLESGHEKGECSNIDTKDYDRKLNQSNGYIEYVSERGSSCDYFSFPNLDHNLGYLLVIESKNISGLPLRVCAANPYSKRCDAYLALPYHKDFNKDVVLLPPMADGGVGYDIHFDNYAVGNIKSVNQLKDLKITPIPYYFLRSQFNQTENYSNEKNLVILNKSFDKGWISLSGGEHVKVNGWANGWIGDNLSNIRIIYLPQVLEFAGFIILFLTWGWFVILFKKGKN